MTTLIHSSAQLAGARVGVDVRVGALAVVGAGAVLQDGCLLEQAACIGEGAIIGAGATVGAGAVVVAGVRVGAGASIEAGAVVTRRVPPRAVVQAKAAAIMGYVDASAHPQVRLPQDARGVMDSNVRGVQLHLLPEVRDLRGDLCVAQTGAGLPFLVQRSFLIYNVPSAELRGEHAHHRCHQFLMAVQGSVRVVADDGVQREEFVLDRPNLGLHLPPMVWATQYRYSAGAMLLVLASDPYDPADYIRDYDEFIDLVQARGTS